MTDKELRERLRELDKLIAAGVMNPSNRMFSQAARPRMRVGPGSPLAPPLPATSSSSPWSDDLELTFDTEPIVGWRVWRTVRIDPPDPGMLDDPQLSMALALRSAVVNELWPWKRRMEARCEHGFHFGDEVPGRDCACGIWAMRDRDELVRRRVLRPVLRYPGDTSGNFWVVGKVALWGRVLEFEEGWRGRYAYPLSLEVLVPDTGYTADTARWIDTLEESYGVPVWSSPQRYVVPRDVQIEAFQKALDDMNKQLSVSLVPAVAGMAKSMVDAQKQFDQTVKALGKDIRVVSMGSSPLWRKHRRRRYWEQVGRNLMLVYSALSIVYGAVLHNNIAAFTFLGLASVMGFLWRWHR